MRAMKIALALAGLLAMVRYSLVYYHSSAFNDFVKQETLRTGAKSPLKGTLLNNAGIYNVAMKADDIKISTVGPVFRVSVDYRVPVNLLVFSHEFQFHTVTGGMLSD
jgi:hypothetical protein